MRSCTQLKARPPEFVILGLQPEAWTPEDSLAWAIMMAWDLGANWNTELMRLRLALKMPKDRIDQLLPPYPGDAVPKTLDYAAFYRGLKLDGQQALAEPALLRLLAAAPESGLEGTGSNSWVLAGSRTTTGKPLLANDPHLKLSTPALWYFARLEAPGLDVAGATMPGLPGVVLGQNKHIAWGFTNTGPDVQDLYLERIKPDDPTQYQTPTGWARFDTRQEVIRVKGQADVALTVRSTRHGPVLSDAVLAGLATIRTARWAPKAGRAMPRAALDRAGPRPRHHRRVAAVQHRRFGGGLHRRQPRLAGADAEHGGGRRERPHRTGVTRAGAAAPCRQRPARPGAGAGLGRPLRLGRLHAVPTQVPLRAATRRRGYIATANQRMTLPDYPHFITTTGPAVPLPAHRADARRPAHPQPGRPGPPACRREESGGGADAAAAAEGALGPPAGRRGAGAAGGLRRHHGRRQGRAADLLGLAPPPDPAGADRRPGCAAVRPAASASAATSTRWKACSAAAMPGGATTSATSAVETCPQQIDRALHRRAGRVAGGAGPRRGRLAVGQGAHRPVGAPAVLESEAAGPWFEVRTPVGGDSYTVNVSRVSLKADSTTGEYYLSEHGPSLRGLYDLADRANSRVVHSTGQSGIVWSPLFRSWAEPWRRVEGVPLFVPASALVQTLSITPAP
jgi:penicillin amidase